MGASLLVPAALLLIDRAFPDPKGRASAIGLWAGLGGVAMAAGPLIGGLLIQALGWRGVFLVNIPIGAVGMLLASRATQEGGPVVLRPLDWKGQVLGIVALATLIAALIEGPQQGWTSWPVLIGLAGGAIAILTFVQAEVLQDHAMLPLSLFRDGVVFGAVLASAVSAATFYGLLFGLSLFFQHDRGFSPLSTGLAFLPLTVLVAAAGSFASGPLLRRHGARRAVSGAFLLYAAGFLGLTFATARTGPYLMTLAMMQIGFAAGLVTPAATGATMASVAPERVGVAAGAVNAARQTGAAFGVAGGGGLVAMHGDPGAGLGLLAWAAAGLSLAAALIWWERTRDGD